MNKSKVFLVIIFILLAGNLLLGARWFIVHKELSQQQTVLEVQETSSKILDFTKFFIEKVLKAEAEVDFETRLKLENAVRNLEDEEILAQWQKFIESRTEIEAQEEVKNLLEVLIGKLRVQ